ncbi:MAG: outer membrane lipoprotein-sorting protein [Deltaproteobacteria bacterium]|nr:outer membrane lipoprotein-sorting protein [Deltaproteobacteria bacterium]
MSLVFGAAPAAAFEPEARELMTGVYERADGDDRHSQMTMVLQNKQGRTRRRSVETFSKDYGPDRKSVMIFLEPADVAGTMFLSWEYDDPDREDDKWLYLPALRKDRRVSGASRREYFMGTDFTYDDMGRRHSSKDDQAILGREELDGRAVVKVECAPVDDDEDYVKRVVWVDPETYLVVRAEYYDKDGLLKVFEAVKIRTQDGLADIEVALMRNVTTGHQTTLTTTKIEYDKGLEDSLFSVSTIQRGRF